MKICLFDIDGTLIRTGGAGQAAFENALRVVFQLDDACDGISFSGRTDRAIVRDVFDRHAIDNTPESWRRFKAAYLGQLPESLHQFSGTVLPGILEVLEHLDPRDDVAVGLLTGNIAEGAQLKLNHYSLTEYFFFGGYGDEHHDRNAVAHEALDQARQHAGRDIPPADVWVIGDTPLDVRCARAIGANAVAVKTGWCDAEELEATEPDLLLDDLSDPAPVWDAIFSD